jgi:hypothetical protein
MGPTRLSMTSLPSSDATEPILTEAGGDNGLTVSNSFIEMGVVMAFLWSDGANRVEQMEDLNEDMVMCSPVCSIVSFPQLHSRAVEGEDPHADYIVPWSQSLVWLLCSHAAA